MLFVHDLVASLAAAVQIPAILTLSAQTRVGGAEASFGLAAKAVVSRPANRPQQQ